MLSFTHFSDEVKFESPRQEDELLNSDDESNLVHEIVVPTCSYRWVSQQFFNREMSWQINLKIKIKVALNKIVSNNASSIYALLFKWFQQMIVKSYQYLAVKRK